MRIVKLWKDGNSKSGQCPALYEAEGGYVVQGKILAPSDAAQLEQVGSDELAVWVPANVLDRLRERA